MEDNSFLATLAEYAVELRQQLKKGDPFITVTPYQPFQIDDPRDSTDRDLIKHESGKFVSHAEYLYSIAINSYAGETIRLSTMVFEIEQILAAAGATMHYDHQITEQIAPIIDRASNRN